MELQNETESIETLSESHIAKLTNRVHELEEMLAKIIHYAGDSGGKPNCGCPMCEAKKLLEAI